MASSNRRRCSHSALSGQYEPDLWLHGDGAPWLQPSRLFQNSGRISGRDSTLSFARLLTDERFESSLLTARGSGIVLPQYRRVPTFANNDKTFVAVGHAGTRSKIGVVSVI